MLEANIRIFSGLKGFATFWEFSFYGHKRSLIMNMNEKIHFHTLFFNFNVLKPISNNAYIFVKEFITNNAFTSKY